jgi:hypothetical protein
MVEDMEEWNVGSGTLQVVNSDDYVVIVVGLWAHKKILWAI